MANREPQCTDRAGLDRREHRNAANEKIDPAEEASQGIPRGAGVLDLKHRAVAMPPVVVPNRSPLASAIRPASGASPDFSGVGASGPRF